MQGVQKDLLCDVECYNCGEEPSPSVMLRAPKLENWSTVVRRRGKERVLVVGGDAYGHPAFVDGTWISTSAIVWFDRSHRFVRTRNRVYVLGKPEIPFEGNDV